MPSSATKIDIPSPFRGMKMLMSWPADFSHSSPTSPSTILRSLQNFNFLVVVQQTLLLFYSVSAHAVIYVKNTLFLLCILVNSHPPIKTFHSSNLSTELRGLRANSS